MSNVQVQSQAWIDDWIECRRESVGHNELLFYTEKTPAVGVILGALRQLISGHYVLPEITQRRIATLGGEQAMDLLRESYPIRKTARSGDLGEIIATEVAEKDLGYNIPIRRLRYKDGRDMALRGDDIIGIKNLAGNLVFLKGESKSRKHLARGVVSEATDALEANSGMPTRHSVLFVANRLSEQGETDLAMQLEWAVLNSFATNTVEHFLFVLCGNNPEAMIRDYLCSKVENSLPCCAVGIQVQRHSDLVANVYAK